MWNNARIKLKKLSYNLFPHFVQNFEFGLSGDPHEVHPFVLTVCLGISEGSGDGNVPGSPNASDVETIPGGPPTGLAAVPALGGAIPG
jgi:hypothetical protein